MIYERKKERKGEKEKERTEPDMLHLHPLPNRTKQHFQIPQTFFLKKLDFFHSSLLNTYHV